MSTAKTEPLTSSPTSQRVPATLRMAPRTIVGALWLFVTLNFLYCDVLSLHDRVYLNAIFTGSAGGVVFTEPVLLAASILMTIPMAAVLLSRIAPHGVARWYSVVAGIVMAVVQVGTLGFGTAPTLQYLYFSAIEIVTTAVIAWYAIARWRIDN